jgi:hypothetical protein
MIILPVREQRLPSQDHQPDYRSDGIDLGTSIRQVVRAAELCHGRTAVANVEWLPAIASIHFQSNRVSGTFCLFDQNFTAQIFYGSTVVLSF